ncbi:GIP [Symbiodinium sp. CCMP2592]|nr:GIP [Symbiodinium sp. CCMP2592]
MSSFYGSGVWQPTTAAAGPEQPDDEKEDEEPKDDAWSGSGGKDTGSDGWSDGQWKNTVWDDHSWSQDSWWRWDQDWSNGWRRRGSRGDSWTTASTGNSSGGHYGQGGDHGAQGAGPGVPRGGDGGVPHEGGRGPSEKMVVPTFAGDADGDELGSSARSYLRQIAAWQKMTRVGADKQALVLYQHLSGPAWVEAERLEMEKLGSTHGMQYFTQWVRDRYLDVQVTQIGRSLSDFFRRLRKRPGQSIREYCGEFDRAHARLIECGCALPDIACAWVFIDRMNLDEAAELNLLASVNNMYDLKLLQKAAIVQDRALRKPWETNGTAPDKKPGGWWRKRANTINMSEHEVEDELERAFDEEEPLHDDDAEELFETYMTHVSAKQKYRDQVRMRGSDPEAIRKMAAEKLQKVKARSFCSGCRRRGHWHKDPECPLNQGAAGRPNGTSTTSAASTSTTATPTTSPTKTPATRENYPCHVVHVTWDLEKDRAKGLQAITDTACSKTVAGSPWIENYITAAREVGYEPEIVGARDAFKFGASKVFESTYAVIVNFGLGSYLVRVKVCVVNGDVPLLLSRTTLGSMGMILDVAENQADFRKVGVHAFQLEVTDTGHPALPVRPEPLLAGSGKFGQNGSSELQLIPKIAQYTVYAAELHGKDVNDEPQNSPVDPFPNVFYPKKIGSATYNMLLDDNFCMNSFVAWWEGTNISNDFWVEGENVLVRVHVIPRKSFFDPRGWSTSQSKQKQLLLNVLGEVRSTWGVACKDYRMLHPQHALWRHENTPTSFATLWIGRTVFARKPMHLLVKGLWDFTKAELLAEAQARGLWVNPKWTVPEIRSIIQEDMGRGAPNPMGGKTALPTGLSKMTLAELQTTAEQLGVTIPDKATKGTIMRLIRDNAGGGTQLVLTFGRYKGYLYSETPMGYRTWAMNEVKANPNRSEDLQMYANWCQENAMVTTKPSRYVDADDPELIATTPYVPEESVANHSWELLARAPRAGSSTSQVPAAKAKAKAYSGARRGAPSTTTSEGGYRRMETELDPDVLDEIHHLETRLAVIKDRHGLTRGIRTPPWKPYVDAIVEEQVGDGVNEIYDEDYEVKVGGFDKELWDDMGEASLDVAARLPTFDDEVYEAEPHHSQDAEHPDIQENQTVYSNYQVPAVGEGSTHDIRENQTVYSNYQVPVDVEDSVDCGADTYLLDEAFTQCVQDRSGASNEDRDGRPLFIEIHTQNNQLSEFMQASGFEVVSIDLVEWDLAVKQNRIDLVQLIVDLEPDVVWCTPEYRLWRSNQSPRDRACEQALALNKDRERHHRHHLSVMNKIYKLQTAGGRLAVLEHPKMSVAWRTKALDSLGGYATVTDMCAYGAVLTDQGGRPQAIKGPTRLQVNHEMLSGLLTRRCAGDHAHLPLRGNLPDGVPRGHAALEHQLGFCEAAGNAIIEALNIRADQAVPMSRPASTTRMCEDGERLAAKKLKEGAFSEGDLLELAQMLPLSRRRRHRRIYGGKDIKIEGIVGGLWTHGGMTGVSSASGEFPNFVTYVNAFMRSRLGSDVSWSSFALNKNVTTGVHSDYHNLPGRPNYTYTFGDFVGGELWVRDEHVGEGERVSRRDVKGNLLHGRNVDTKDKVYEFDARGQHATQPWKGDRWCLTCFVTRGYRNIRQEDKDRLRAMKFPLRHALHEVKERNHLNYDNRPKKSERRRLWRTAKRLVALATWSTFVTSTCTTTGLHPPNNSGSVALFEIGDDVKTFELESSELLTAEPFLSGDLAEETRWTGAYDVLRELRPGTLWIHGEAVTKYPEQIQDLASEQLRKGRQVVFGASSTAKPFWNAPWLTEIGSLAVDVNYEVVGETKLMRLNCVHQENQAYITWTQECSDPHPENAGYMTTDNNAGEGADTGEGLTGSRAISFTPGPKIKPEVQASLKRLHQNLGHIGYEDMGRHLRLAGAGPEVVSAAKRLRCQVCARNKRGGSARPSSAPNLLEFNQVVAVDAFSAYDSWGKRYEFMSILDCGTSFHVVFPLSGHSTETMEKDFCVAWSHVFGPPGTLALDLESGLQASFARYSEFYGVKIRSAAGQAHWQQGAVERHNRLWKEIWDRTVDDHSVTEGEVHLAVTAVNSAVNELRRKHGYSPSQAVWGRDPEMPGELLDGKDLEQYDHVISRDHQRAREHALRVAAKENFFRCQSDDKLRRALLQRSRVSGPDLSVGDFVYFYRKAKNQKFWQWHGPATIIGHEGINLWVSKGGRCHLVAPEHLRRATSEEIGDAFVLRTTQADLEKILELDPDEILFEGDDPAEGDPEMAPGDDDVGNGEDEDILLGGQGVVRDGEHLQPSAAVTKRYRTKGPQEQDDPGALPQIPDDDYDPDLEEPEVEMTETNEAMMLKRAKTARGREKQLEKELPWSMIPVEQHEAFREAENKQYQEHLDHGALEPLTVEESQRILRERGDRVLPSRFAYRDKALAKRRKDPTVAWKHKSRLVIGGHMDPDIGQGLNTMAPTVSRQSIMLLLQILASRLHQGWNAYAGDITAAFLNGGELQREEVTALRPEDEQGNKCLVEQCPLDPCVFFVKKILGRDADGEFRLTEPIAYLAVHVDDVLLIGNDEICQLLKKLLSKVFPIDDWESGAFEYIGSFIEVNDGSVKVSQESYVESRLFQVEIPASQADDEPATEEQLFDNRSLVGALSWLAGQTRPDLQASVSMCQQLQKNPTAGDLRFSNLVARRAEEHKDQGVTFYPIDLDNAALLCYHDAGWANAPQDADDPYYCLTAEEEAQGAFKEGPFMDKPRKTKRSSSCIASQLGCIYVLANRSILHGEP